MGKSNGNETTWDNTQITATKQLNTQSGHDTALMGAQLAGTIVSMQVGGNLNITTLQNSSQYNSEQSSSGAGLNLCIPPLCYGTTVTGSLSMSEQNIAHNYLSAIGQSGITAGTGGYDITVSHNTYLHGAAITSSAFAKDNYLTTGSLSYQDIDNQQQTKVSSSNNTVGYGGGSLLTNLAANATGNLLNTLAGNASLPDNHSEHSQTLSVISSGNITITGTGGAGADQQSLANVARLTERDPETAHQALSNTLTLQQAEQLERDIAEQQQNIRAASLVGTALSGAIGDLSIQMQWEEGSPQKIALHGLAGLIEAEIGKGNALASMAAGAANEALVGRMAEYLKGQNITRDEYEELMRLGSTLLGSATGALVSGNVKGAAAGATAAYLGTSNNFLTHEEEKELSKLKKECEAAPDSRACERKNELEALDKKRDAAVQALIDLCQQQGKKDCAKIAKEFANVLVYNKISAEYESKERGPFGFNGKENSNSVAEDSQVESEVGGKTKEPGYDKYDAPKIKQKDGTYKEDPGGLSYGPFQLSSMRGGLEDFMMYLKNNQNKESQYFYKELMKAGGLEAARRGDAKFVDTFMRLTMEDPQFIAYQFTSIDRNGNMKEVRSYLDRLGVKFENLSPEQQNAIFSTVVQSGRRGVAAIRFAFESAANEMNDEYKNEFSWKVNEIKISEVKGNKLSGISEDLLEKSKGMEGKIKALQAIQIELITQGKENNKSLINRNQKKINEMQKKIDDLQSIIDKNKNDIENNNKYIKEIKDWLLPSAKKGADNTESFINNIYEWRIKSQPSEEKTRYILERDKLLREFRNRMLKDNDG